MISLSKKTSKELSAFGVVSLVGPEDQRVCLSDNKPNRPPNPFSAAVGVEQREEEGFGR